MVGKFDVDSHRQRSNVSLAVTATGILIKYSVGWLCRFSMEINKVCRCPRILRSGEKYWQDSEILYFIPLAY